MSEASPSKRHLERWEARLREHLNEQPAGDAWAEEKVAAIRAAVSEGRIDVAGLVDLECRATLCRAEFMHVNLAQRLEFAADIGMDEPLTGGGVLIPTSDTGTVVYLLAPGHRLPAAPESG